MRRLAIGLMSLALLLSATPALAHAGGRAQLYVASANVSPGSGGWSVAAVVRDLDSGAPAPGFGVEITASGPAGALAPVTLADDGDGRYESALPGLTDGSWAMTVRAFEIPGGNAALSVQRTWTVSLRPGQAVELARSGSPARRAGSGSNPLLLELGVGLAVGLGVVSAMRLGRHRRITVPVR
jgi:hypothetical protein